MLKLFFKFSYGSWISAIISFFSIPIITSLIIPEEFGKAAMFTLAINFFMQIVQLGTDQSFVRFFYEKPENERSCLFSTCFFLPLLLTGIFAFFILTFWKPLSNLLFESLDFKAIILLVICLLFSVSERFATLVIRMKQRGNLFSIIKIINSVVYAGVVFLYAYYIERNFHAILFASICACFVCFSIAVFAERKWYNFKVGINKIDIKPILNYGLPFIPIFVISWIFEGMDKIALKTWSTFEEIGLYSAGFKIVALLTILQVGFCTFWAPVAVQKYEENHNNTYFFEHVFKYISFILIIATVGLILFKDIIILLFASSYREAAHIMPFLVFVPFMCTLSEITGVGIGFKKQTYWGFVVFSGSALVNFFGNYLLVPFYGAKGAALSTATAYIVFFLLRTYLSIRLFPMNFNLGKTALTFLLLYVVAGINTFVANKTIGISCAAIAIFLYSLFNLSTIKDVFVYFKQIVVKHSTKKSIYQ